MAEHTTNYTNTLIAIAPDSSATIGVEPPCKVENPSIAWRTWQLIHANPYRFTSDDVIFTVYADRNAIEEADRPAAREKFFSKGQPCLRASDLGKKYGWGIHANEECRIALFGVESPEYAAFVAGETITPDGEAVTVRPAMRSSR